MSKKKDEKTDPKTPKPDEEGPHAFSLFLQRLEDGVLHADLSSELQRLNSVLADVASQQGTAKGAMVITINLSHNNGIVGITSAIATKEPKRERGASVMWLTKGHNLSPDNPNGKQMKLFEVPGSQPAIEVEDDELTEDARSV